MYYTPLTCYEEKVLGVGLILSPSPEHRVLRLLSLKLWTQKMFLSVLQVGIPVLKIHNSALLKVKEFTYQQHMQTQKECGVTKECAYTVFLSLVRATFSTKIIS